MEAGKRGLQEKSATCSHPSNCVAASNLGLTEILELTLFIVNLIFTPT